MHRIITEETNALNGACRHVSGFISCEKLSTLLGVGRLFAFHARKGNAMS
jgi:hypothetical protein